MPLKCHLAPVNSAVVLKQLRDNTWPLCNSREMKLKIAVAPYRTPGCQHLPGAALQGLPPRADVGTEGTPQPTSVLPQALPGLCSSLTQQFGAGWKDAGGCCGILGQLRWMLGDVRVLLKIFGGSWGMRGDVGGCSGDVGAAKLPILAPGTECFLPKPRQGAVSSLPEPNVGTDATISPA